MPIAQNLNHPNVHEYEEGVVKFLEFETDIWIMELRAKKRGQEGVLPDQVGRRCPTHS